VPTSELLSAANRMFGFSIFRTRFSFRRYLRVLNECDGDSSESYILPAVDMLRSAGHLPLRIVPASVCSRMPGTVVFSGLNRAILAWHDLITIRRVASVGTSARVSPLAGETRAHAPVRSEEVSARRFPASQGGYSPAGWPPDLHASLVICLGGVW
jgi:hypothetical protein